MTESNLRTGTMSASPESQAEALSETNEPAPLWTPPAPQDTHTHALLQEINTSYKLSPPLVTYEDLWRFSVTRQADFWSTVWDTVGVIGTKGRHVVDETRSVADNPDWFKDAEVNWAENMCRWKDGEEGKRVAFVQVGESNLLS